MSRQVISSELKIIVTLPSLTKNKFSSKVSCPFCKREFSKSTLNKYQGICYCCYISENNFLHELQRYKYNRAQDNIESLKYLKYADCKHNDCYKQNDCAICLTGFQDTDTIPNLSCKHFLHKKCISRHLESSRSCPICRKDICNVEKI